MPPIRCASLIVWPLPRSGAFSRAAAGRLSSARAPRASSRWGHAAGTSAPRPRRSTRSSRWAEAASSRWRRPTRAVRRGPPESPPCSAPRGRSAVAAPRRCRPPPARPPSPDWTARAARRPQVVTTPMPCRNVDALTFGHPRRDRRSAISRLSTRRATSPYGPGTSTRQDAVAFTAFWFRGPPTSAAAGGRLGSSLRPRPRHRRMPAASDRPSSAVLGRLAGVAAAFVRIPLFGHARCGDLDLGRHDRGRR